jgi:uncharacterized protein (TIGR02594 family)
MHPNLALIERIDFTPYPWMKPALKEYGTMRVHGHPDANPRVLEYLRVVGLPRKGMDDDEPWCSAFVNWCMKQVGIRGSMGGLARGWLRGASHLRCRGLAPLPLAGRQAPCA